MEGIFITEANHGIGIVEGLQFSIKSSYLLLEMSCSLNLLSPSLYDSPVSYKKAFKKELGHQGEVAQLIMKLNNVCLALDKKADKESLSVYPLSLFSILSLCRYLILSYCHTDTPHFCPRAKTKGFIVTIEIQWHSQIQHKYVCNLIHQKDKPLSVMIFLLSSENSY